MASLSRSTVSAVRMCLTGALAALALAGCDFSSRAPFVAVQDAAWPLQPGAYMAQAGPGDFSAPSTQDPPGRATLARTAEGYALTLPDEDQAVSLLLYRVSPSVYIAQTKEDSGLWSYGALKITGTKAALYPLSCNQFTNAELTRFGAAWEKQTSDPDSSREVCVFQSLDAVVAAAFQLLNREMAPSLTLAPATP